MARNTNDVLAQIDAEIGVTPAQVTPPAIEWSTPRGAGIVLVPETTRPIAVSKIVTGQTESGADITRWVISGLETTGHELDGQEFPSAIAARRAVESGIVSIMALWSDETPAQDAQDAPETDETPDAQGATPAPVQWSKVRPGTYSGTIAGQTVTVEKVDDTWFVGGTFLRDHAPEGICRVPFRTATLAKRAAENDVPVIVANVDAQDAPEVPETPAPVDMTPADRIAELEAQLAALRDTGQITPETPDAPESAPVDMRSRNSFADPDTSAQTDATVTPVPATDVEVYDAGPFATNPAPNLATPAPADVSADIIDEAMATGDAMNGEIGYRQYLAERAARIGQVESDKAMASEVRDSIGQYLILPAALRDAYLGVMALWTMHTYVYRAQGTTPYLAISAPTRGAGKTTVLQVLRNLAHNPTRVEINPTEPVIRVHASHARTLFLDEIDELARKGGSFVQILNSGYKEGGAVSRTIRIKGVGTDTEDFPTFTPKAFAAIAREGFPLAAATMERCITLRIERATPQEVAGIRRFRQVEANRDAREIRAALDDWSQRVDRDIRDARPDMPEMSTARAAEIWEPLFAIADSIGWGSEVREWATLIDGDHGEQDEDPNALFLADVRDVMTQWVERYPTEKYMPAKELPALRNANPERRLSEQLTPVATGKRLGAFGIRSTPVKGERVYKIGNGDGTLLDALTATFARYCD